MITPVDVEITRVEHEKGPALHVLISHPSFPDGKVYKELLPLGPSDTISNQLVKLASSLVAASRSERVREDVAANREPTGYVHVVALERNDLASLATAR